MIEEDNSRGIWDWNLVKVIMAVAVITFVFIFINQGFSDTALQQVIRWSAKYSFLLFCLAFAASGIHRWWRRSFSYWLLMNRKYLGISFALIHLIHLGFLLVRQYFFYPLFQEAATFSLLSGTIAYIFLVLMLLTSFRRWAQYLSIQAWKRLHTVGAYWIWGVFFVAYAKRLLVNGAYLPYVLLLLLVLAFRYWAWQYKAS